MSVHLIDCAGSLQHIGKSHKLALIAFADSAHDRTHIAFPGYEGVMRWASCSRSRAAELIADLVAAGLLRPHSTARPGRRAEYVVFPDGCCDAHRIPHTDPGNGPTTDDLLAALDAAGVQLTSDQLDQLGRPNVSENPDPSPPDGSENPDPFTDGSGNASEISDPSGQRVQNASENPDPFATPTTNPPSPATASQGRCRRHPITPGVNCRACGTSPRQVQAAAQREVAEGRRLAEQEAARRSSAAAAAAAVDSRNVRELLDQTRQTIRRTG